MVNCLNEIFHWLCKKKKNSKNVPVLSLWNPPNPVSLLSCAVFFKFPGTWYTHVSSFLRSLAVHELVSLPGKRAKFKNSLLAIAVYFSINPLLNPLKFIILRKYQNSCTTGLRLKNVNFLGWRISIEIISSRCRSCTQHNQYKGQKTERISTKL